METPVISKGSWPYSQRNKITTNTKHPVVKVFLTYRCYIFESLTHKSLVMFLITEYGPPITIQWEQFAKHFNAKIPVSMLIRPDLWNLQHVIFFKPVKELGGVWRGFGWKCMRREKSNTSKWSSWSNNVTYNKKTQETKSKCEPVQKEQGCFWCADTMGQHKSIIKSTREPVWSPRANCWTVFLPKIRIVYSFLLLTFS